MSKKKKTVIGGIVLAIAVTVAVCGSLYLAKSKQTVNVPDMTGLDAKEAKTVLQQTGIQDVELTFEMADGTIVSYEEIEKGQYSIIASSPAAGLKVNKKEHLSMSFVIRPENE